MRYYIDGWVTAKNKEKALFKATVEGGNDILKINTLEETRQQIVEFYMADLINAKNEDEAIKKLFRWLGAV